MDGDEESEEVEEYRRGALGGGEEWVRRGRGLISTGEEVSEEE